MPAVLRQGLLLIGCTLLLALPMLVNRGAVLFADTTNYVNSGRYALAMAGLVDRDVPAAPQAAVATPVAPISGRSPYYGIFAAAADAVGGTAGVAWAQAFWLALVLVIALPWLGFVGNWSRLVVTAVLALLTSLGFFTAVVLPDVFAGVAILALTLLLCRGAAMPGWQRWFWAANLAVAAVFHTAILLTAVVLLGVVAALRGAQRHALAGIALPALALGLAAAATLAVPGIVAGLTGKRLVPVPFLLARVIADGPGRRVLAADCPAAGYAACHFVAGVPMGVNELLWDGGEVTAWTVLPDHTRFAVAGEENRIVFEALRRYPGEQLSASLGNFAGQLVNTDVTRFATVDVPGLDDQAQFAAARSARAQSRIGNGTLPLPGLSQLWGMVYLVGAGVAALALAGGRRPSAVCGVTALRHMAAILLLSLVISAAVTGMLSGDVGRYQARLSWLAVLASVMLVAPLAQRGLVRMSRERAIGWSARINSIH